MSEHITPGDVVDRMLWREAQRVLDRHTRVDGEEECSWCGGSWPCAPRRLAERAEVEAYRPPYEVLSKRIDLRELPGGEDDPDLAGAQLVIGTLA